MSSIYEACTTAPVVAMQSAGKHFTGAGGAAVCQDDYRLLCQLPRLRREHFSGQSTCLWHKVASVSLTVTGVRWPLQRLSV